MTYHRLTKRRARTVLIVIHEPAKCGAKKARPPWFEPPLNLKLLCYGVASHDYLMSMTVGLETNMGESWVFVCFGGKFPKEYDVKIIVHGHPAVNGMPRIDKSFLNLKLVHLDWVPSWLVDIFFI